MYLEIMKRRQQRYDTLNKLAENSDFLYNAYHKSDRGYKYLFGIKKCFLEFLCHFLKQVWVNKLTEKDIEMVNGEYILNNFDSQVSDIVYKITKNEEDVYFVLLELQSKNDEMMAFRVLEYMLEIWRRHKNNYFNSYEDKRLPLIIPCVLYTGKTKWTGKRNFRELVKNYEKFEKIVPSFEYIIIDINNYEDEELLSLSGIISKAMYVDKGKDIDELKERLETIISSMGKLSEEEQEYLFNWATHLVVKDVKEMNEL